MKKMNFGPRLTLIFTYICIALFVAAVIFLPMVVTWYVETMGRSSELATTVMLTCYPCSPFAAIALLSVRLVVKDIISGKVFDPKNITRMFRVSGCCLAAGVIMLFAGNFYMPFYIAGAAAVFCSLMSKVFADIIKIGIPEKRENEENEK